MPLTSNDQYLLESLQERGKITAEQLEDAQTSNSPKPQGIKDL